MSAVARPTVAAVVPALDEAAAIPAVVRALRAQPAIDEVIVVNNGSTDRTAALAGAAGARVVPEPRRGYGRACRAGVAATTADVILLLDGDGADHPDDVPRVLAPLFAGDADLVVGSRALGQREAGAMAPQQVLGNRVATALLRLHGLRATDIGPMRAIRRADLEALGMTEMTYGWSVEMMVKAARHGLRYHEVPVTYRRRAGTSKVSGTLRGALGAGWGMLSAIARHSRWRPEAARP